MHNPATAYHHLQLSLARLQVSGCLAPGAHACILAPHPDTDPWQISLVIQHQPFGLRLCGHLPLHASLHEIVPEDLLRACNDLNRQLHPFTFSLDPLGLVIAFRAWLPLPRHPGAMLKKTAFALSLAEQAVRLAAHRFQLPPSSPLQHTDQSVPPALCDDEIPF